MSGRGARLARRVGSFIPVPADPLPPPPQRRRYLHLHLQLHLHLHFRAEIWDTLGLCICNRVCTWRVHSVTASRNPLGYRGEAGRASLVLGQSRERGRSLWGTEKTSEAVDTREDWETGVQAS